MANADVDLPLGYRDPQFLGGGSGARVFRCVEQADGGEVAVKLFDQTLNDPGGGAAAFRRECQVARTLSAHPGVVKVRAAGITASGRPWMAMDLAVNGTLAELIEHSGRARPLAQALSLTATLADTIAWAHQRELPVIHGDIRPANILLDAEWRPLLGDFGVATDVGARQIARPYAAPEVLRDGHGSVASDIWSVTATMFELVTGAAPFPMEPDEGPDDFIDRVQRGLPAAAIAVTVPQMVAAILRDGLTVDPDQRTPSMAILGQAVRAAQIQLNLPMTAPVPSPEPDLASEMRFVSYAEAIVPTTSAPPHPVKDAAAAPPPRRRRRAWIAVAAAVLVLGLTGTGIAVAGSSRGSTPHAGGSPTSTAGGGTPTQLTTPASATHPASGPTTPSPGGSTPTAHSGAGSGHTQGQRPTAPSTTSRPQPTTPDPITNFTVSPTGSDGQATVSFNAPASHGTASTVSCYVDTTNCGMWPVPVGGATGVTRTISGLPNGQAVTVRLQDCNSNTSGQPCDSVVQAPVTAYGPMSGLTIAASASGPTVTFTISVNPDGKAATVQVSTSRQSQTFTTGVSSWTWSGSDNVGYSGNDTITVTVSDAGRSTLSRQVSQATPGPPATVTVSRGTPCGGGGGSACTGGTCSNSSCGYIHVATANFSGTVSCTFNSDQGSGGWVQNVTWGPNQSKDAPNWYGRSGSHVYVTCGGVTGSFTWP